MTAKMDPHPSKKVVQVLLNVIKKHWSFHGATGAYSPLKTPVFFKYKFSS